MNITEVRSVQDMVEQEDQVSLTLPMMYHDVFNRKKLREGLSQEERFLAEREFNNLAREEVIKAHNRLVRISEDREARVRFTGLIRTHLTFTIRGNKYFFLPFEDNEFGTEFIEKDCRDLVSLQRGFYDLMKVNYDFSKINKVYSNMIDAKMNARCQLVS